MATYEVIHPVAGLQLFAYPLGTAYPLSAWNTHKVAMTESNKLYTATIDLTKSTKWAIFQGSGQPTDFDAALYEDQFFVGSDGIGVPVNVTPGSISSIHRGDNSYVRLFYNENANVVIPITIDITLLDVRFVIEDETQTNIYERTNSQIARTTTSFTVLIPDTVTSALKSYIWSLRETATSKLLVKGSMQVEYAAD